MRVLLSRSSGVVACYVLLAGCSSKHDATNCDASGPCNSGGASLAAATGGAVGTGGSSQTSTGGAAEGGSSPDGASESGGTKSVDASTASTCVPSMPALPWTSPYAKWTRGIPTDRSFFPIAVWLQGSWHADELHQLGVNIYVGNNAGTDPMAASDLATIKKLGMYAIVGQDSVGLANKDDPTIVGWWMSPDEPDNAQPASGGGYGPPVAPSTLVTEYDAFKAADPTRPVYLGLGQGVAYDAWEGRGSNVPPESAYVPASDLVDFDIYPYNNCGGDPNEQATCGQFWLNAFGVDRLRQWSDHDQAVWTDIETTVISAGTTTGPTPEETKSEVWLSLIHGANGFAYFLDTWQPSFREDGIFSDAAMVTAVTALDRQITALAPVLNSATFPNFVGVKSANSAAPLDVMVKGQGTSVYVFAAVSRKGTTTGSFAINGMTGSGVATVVGENRSIDVKAGAFSDMFAENGVHIYEIDLSTVHCE